MPVKAHSYYLNSCFQIPFKKSRSEEVSSCTIYAKRRKKHQSTLNGNLPLRMLFYVCQLLRKLVKEMAVPVADPELELTVTAYNINAEHNAVLMEKCRPLKEYADFIDRVRCALKGKTTDGEKLAALEKMIDECIRDGIMKDFLENHREVVIKMNLVEYNEQDEREGILEDGIEQGMERGISALNSFVRKGIISEVQAAESLNMSVDEYRTSVMNIGS